MSRTSENFTANWIGRCPSKGCKGVIQLTIPMIRERWVETHHNHALGHSYPVPKSESFCSAPFSRNFSPRHLYLSCTQHRRELLWVAIKGKLVEDHKCDSRCMNATGPNCDCSCGGENHGRSFHVNIK